MALLTSQAVQITGPAITYSAAADPDTVVPDPRAFYHVKVGATATTVTVVTPSSLDRFGQALPDIQVGPLTSTDRFIGPLVPELADPATGLITINHSQITGVTGAVVRL